MKIKVVTAIVGITVLLAVLCALLYFRGNQDNMLPSKLYRELGCDRISLDIKTTDVYCNDYNLYKKNHAAGKI